MSGRSGSWLVVGALALGMGLLTGCPSGGGATPQQAQGQSLELNADKHSPEVGNDVQLRLSFSGGASQQMMGAMMGEASTTTWFADPADAVSFDPTGKATFKKAGKVKIWATYPKTGSVLKSNVLEIEVKGADAQPAEAKPAK